jgi:hypothetical protein
MRWDLNDTDRRQSDTGPATKRARRPQIRTARRPIGPREANNLVASFGMIAGLLLFWAMAVSL